MSAYVPGQELKIRLTPWSFAKEGRDHDALSEQALPDDQNLILEIVRVVSPPTLSAVLWVKLKQQPAAEASQSATDDPSSASLDLDTTYILKLFDRRHMHNLREYSYDAALESEYQQYLARPDRIPIAFNQRRPMSEDYDEEDERAVHEEWIDWFCARTLKLELDVYHRLMLDPSKRSYGTVETETDIGPIRGSLIEHIYPSVTLSQFVKGTAPCGHLSQKVEQICQEALDTLGRLNNEYLLNGDVRFDNILVRLGKEWPAKPSAKCPDHLETSGCVFIDFGQASLRHADETDFEWCRAKSDDSEAGRFPQEAARRFKEAGAGDCPYHDQLCRLAESSPDDHDSERRIGDLKLLLPRLGHNPFTLNLTDEEERIAPTNHFWGLYDWRPHAQTYEEALERYKNHP